jgi:phage protein U
MQLCLGQFVFSINTVAYQELQRATDWRYASNSRVGERPASQYIGQGTDTITVSGWVAPELTGDAASIDTLRYMGDQGAPYILISGTGAVFGLWEIHNLTETKTLFWPDGTPRRITFNLTLSRVDDNRIDQVGLITDASTLLL